MKRAVYPLHKWMMMIITIIEYVCLLLLFLDCRLLGVFFLNGEKPSGAERNGDITHSKTKQKIRTRERARDI